MNNLWHKWKYRYSKLEMYDRDRKYMESDIFNNYYDNPYYDPRQGWFWLIERKYKGHHAMGIGRTRKEAYDEIKEVEEIHDELLKEIENERK